MSKLMVKRDGLWTPMDNLKGDTGPLPADNSVTNDALVTDGAKTNTAYLMRNRLTKDAEGELISVDDSYPSAALSLTVDGKSTQVQTTGKNLWNDARYSEAGWMYEGAGYYNGKIYNFYHNINDLGNGSYPESTQITISLNIVKTGSAGTMQLRFDYTDGTTSHTSNIESGKYKYSYTSTAGKTVARAYIYTTAGPTNVNFHFSRLQVEIGTSGTEYEPYSGNARSPSPTYPQQIDSITEPRITLAGKNLIDGNADAWEIGSLNHIGQNIANSTRLRTKDYIRLLPITYIISVSSGYLVSCVYYYDEKKNYLTRVNPSSETFQIAINDAAYVRILLSDADIASEVTIDDVSTAQPMLAMGTEAATYESYAGAKVALDLSETPLRSLPDGTKDELYLKYLRPSSRAGLAWYEPTLVQRVGEVDLGDSGWTMNRTLIGCFARSDGLENLESHGVGIIDTMCTNYIAQEDRTNYTVMHRTDKRISIYYGREEIVIIDKDYDDAGDFMESVNGVMAYYPLATPITTTLDPIELPIMQAGITNIWSDPSTNLSVTYERDRNIVISKLEAAAADLATS